MSTSNPTKRTQVRVQLRFLLSMDDDVTLAELKRAIDSGLGRLESAIEETAPGRIATVDDGTRADAVRLETPIWDRP